MIKFIRTSEKIAGLFFNDKLHNLFNKYNAYSIPTSANNGKLSMDIEMFEEIAPEIHKKISSPKYDDFNEFVCRVKHTDKKTWLLLLVEYVESYSSCRNGEISYNVILKMINHEIKYIHDKIEF